jgi:tetratricopeptide (TPR) repeat protein
MRREADAYSSYESLLVRLHELDRAGALDSEEADAVRDQMDEPWARLGRFERERLANLSADLTCDSAESQGTRSTAERAALLAQARSAYAHRQWDALLSLLRATGDQFPRSLVAYMRGRCWSALGRPEAAHRFFEDARAADPDNANYELLALDALFRSDRHEQAFELHSQLLDMEATCDAMHRLVVDELQSLDPEDSLILMYAGHGMTRITRLGDKELRFSYVLPLDATPGETSSWIDLDDWLQAVARLPHGIFW